jgi:transcriptional/translational regulatory protein YebC/TACO1
VATALEARLGEARSTGLVWRPKTTTPVAGEEAQAVLRLMDALEDEDEVQNVYANFEMSDEELARLSAA